MNPLQKTITYLLTGLTLLSNPINSLAINPKTEAYKTFEKIVKIRGSYAKARGTVRVYINDLADKIGHRDGHASSEEILNALEKLESVEWKIADKYFGNKNGIMDIEDFNNMNSEREKYPGLFGLEVLRRAHNL